MVNIDTFLDCGCTDIRVSFKLPLGKTRYESHEDRGYVEVCLILLSDYHTVLGTAVTVTLSPARTSSTIFVRGRLHIADRVTIWSYKMSYTNS